MKPCDCRDINDTETKLDHAGISVNDNGISVMPNVVILREGNCELKIPMHRFKMYATWYLEDQVVEPK